MAKMELKKSYLLYLQKQKMIQKKQKCLIHSATGYLKSFND